MLKLNAGYSKKVPVEGADFSSRSYHASVEIELPGGLDSNELSGRIRDTFALVRDSVEREISGGSPRTGFQNNGGNGNGQHKRPGQPASEKQIGYLRDIAAGRGMTIQQLEAEVRRRFGAGTVRQLTRSQASKLIDSLAAVSGNSGRMAA